MADREIVFRYSADGISELMAKLEALGVSGDIAVKKIKDGSHEASAGLKALDEAGSLVHEKMQEFAGSAGGVGQILSALGPAGLGAAAGIGAIFEVVKESVGAAAALEQNMLRVQAVLHATGGVSGQTAKSIEEISVSMARTTTATEASVQQAAAQLLTFRDVSGEAFEGTLKAAQDLAAAGFGSLAENAVKLGRAMEDPAHGLDQLRRMGIALDDEVKGQIRTLHEQGDVMAANALLIDEITKRVGGTGAAERGTLTGAWHGFTTELDIWMETSPLAQAVLQSLKAGIDDVSGSLQRLNESNKLAEQIDDLQQKLRENQASGGPLTVFGNAGLQAQIDILQKKLDLEKAAQAVAKEAAQTAALSAQQDRIAAEAKSQFNAEVDAETATLNAQIAAQIDASIKANDEAAKRAAADQKVIQSTAERADEEKRLQEAFLQGHDAYLKVQEDIAVRIELDKLSKDATAATRAEVEAHTRALFEEKQALDDEKSAQEQATEAKKKAAADAAKFARDQAKAVADFSQKTSDEIVQSFFNMAEGSKAPFDNLKAYAIKTFEEIAAAALIRPIIQPLIADAIGGITGVGGAGGGIGGALNTAGSAASLYQFGTGQSLISGGLGSGLSGWLNGVGTSIGFAPAAGTIGLASNGTIMGVENLSPTIATGAGSLTSVLGGAGLGALGGGLIASLTGGNKTFDSVAGAGIGGAYAAGAIGGPVALGLAAVATILGTLFNHPSVKNEGFTGNLDTGSLSQIGGVQGGGKFSSDNLTAAQGFANAVNALVTGLTSTTGGHLAAPGGNTFGINVNNKAVDFGLGTTGAAQEFPDIASAWKFASAEIVKDMTDMPAEFQTALKQVDLSTQDGVSAAINQLTFVKSFLDLQKSLAQTVTPVSQISATFTAAHDNVAALANQVEALGVSADEVNKTLSDFDAAFRANYVKDLQSTFNQASGQGFLNTIQTAISQHTTSLADEKAIGVASDLVDKIFGAQIQSALGGLTVDQLATVASYFSQIPEVVAAVNTALASLTQTQAVTGAAATALNSMFDQRIANLNAEATALTNTSSAWQKAADAIGQFNGGLLTDSSLSPLGLGDQVSLAKKQFQDAYTAAMGGDVNAAASLPNLAKTFLTLDKQFDASSAAYAANFNLVQSQLTQAQGFASAQVSVASQQLTVLTQILAALTTGKAALSGGAAASQAYTASDFNSFASAYNSAVSRSGLSANQFIASSQFAPYEDTFKQIVGGLNDPSFLTSLYGAVSSHGASDPNSAVYSEQSAAIAARLTQLGVNIPKYALGGPVTNTGLAYVHAGEHVSTQADMASVAAEVRALRATVEGLVNGTMTGHERTIAKLQAVADNTKRAADAPQRAATLAATAATVRFIKP